MKRLVVGLVLAALLALAPAANAATMVVNSNAVNFGDDGLCTLPEAIDSANQNVQNNPMMGECDVGEAEPIVDVINFQNPPFTGMVATTIVTAGLPDVSEDVTISAGTIGAILKPRVGVRVNPAGANEGLAITNGAAVTVDGLAITGATTGIDATGGTLAAEDVWIGLSLDQSVVGGNSTGIKLASNSTVGSLSADRPNVFAANGVGIETVGGDNNTIIGNYFGSKSDGTLATNIENGTNIRITDNSVGPDPASGNVIGGADTGTAAFCDTTCNLISNANGTGIELSGGGNPAATGPTTISGNYIGLAFNGTAGVPAIGNDGSGVEAGAATNVTIGGATDAHRNFIGGNGADGINTTAGLTVARNFLGLDSTGTIAIPDASDALAIQPPAAGATVSRNRVGGAGLNIFGNLHSVQNNIIGIGTGGENVGFNNTPLSVFGDSNTIGGVGAGNTIGNHALIAGDAAALTVTGDDNEVLGNFVGVDSGGVAHPNASNGIALAAGGFESDDNQIGGTAAGEANTISNSARDAIRLPSAGAGSDGNTFVGNLGRSNGSAAADLFIELGPDGPGNGGGSQPNEDVGAPVIGVGSDADGIEGTSSLPDGAVVDVYKTISLRGDVRSRLGSTTVSGSNWSFSYPTTFGAGTCVGVTQTTADGSTSEMATTSVGGGPCDVVGPTTTIDSGPEDVPPTSDTTPTFGFSSSDVGSTFECSLNGAAFSACTSPVTTPVLAEGDHTFQVRATDSAENLGPPSALRSFEIDVTAPQTTVTGFRKRPRRRRAVVTFTSNDPTATFQCKLNSQGFAPCATPSTFRRLKRGKRHTIQVRALDAAGNVDATPTTNRIRIPRARR